MAVDVFAEERRLRAAPGDGVLIPAKPRDPFPLHQHVIDEEPEPDALALAAGADQIHAIVPVAGAHER